MSSPDLNKRIGSFSIPRKLLQEDPELCLEILDGVVVLEANYHYYNDSSLYIGLHPSFEPIEPFTIPNKYVYSIEEGKWSKVNE
jgi:hypothetical protein